MESSPAAAAAAAAAAATAPPPPPPPSSSHDEDVHNDGRQLIATTQSQSQAPSHILQDGRFVFLPPPSAAEERQFVEHSIKARHGLLQQDMMMMMDDKAKTKDEEEEGEEEEEIKKKSDHDKIKIHPLALACDRLQNHGINELNRAINLATLVQTGEYFGLSNVVADANAASAAVASLEVSKSNSDDLISSEQQQPSIQQADADKASMSDSSTTSSSGSPSPSASASATASASGASAKDTGGSSSHSSVVVTAEMQQAERVRASYVLKRKQAQFRRACSILSRHRDRLKSAIVAERRPLRRFAQLRQQHWRLVAPEHGVRALPHAAPPTETLSCDVDVYLQQQQQLQLQNGSTLNTAGRLARRVPRYATIELKKEYSVDEDLKTWKNSRQWIQERESQKDHGDDDDDDDDDDEENNSSSSESDRDRKKDVEMKDVNDNDDDDESQKATQAQSTTENAKDEQEEETWTRAEPFAIADPTLGKLDADFDPSKVAMLTLQFKIEASTTSTSTTFGRRRSVQACLEPFAAAAAAGTDSKAQDSSFKYQEDEKVLVALQHSLFCAKLFESIRRELAADTEELGANGTGNKGAASSFSSAVWLSSDGQGTSNFLPAPHLMIRGGGGGGASGTGIDDDDDLVNSKVCQPLAVIHCHEGEVMLQLDCEYTLRIKLVEAGSEQHHNDDNDNDNDDTNGMETTSNGDGPASSSSSSSTPQPDYLLLLCRALLLHAQETYHRHSLRQEEKQRKLVEEGDDSSKKIDISMMHNRKDGTTAAVLLRKVEAASPRILQSCVSLGSKMLLERRIRATLVKVKAWLTRRLKQTTDNNNNTNGNNDSAWNTLQVEWLSLSILDQHAQFTVSFRSWHVDVHLAGDRITVTHFASAADDTSTTLDASCYRKVDFYSDTEFELFLRNSLKQQL